MRKSAKPGLFFGIFTFISIVVVTAIEWVWHWQMPDGIAILQLLSRALVTGLLAGLFFSWFTRKFTKAIGKGLQQNSNELFKTHGAFRSPANHFRGIEARGGELILKDRKIYFNPHQFNLQRQTVEIDVQSIKKAATKKYFFGLVDTGLQLTLNNGNTENFVIGNQEEWIAAIREAQQAMPA